MLWEFNILIFYFLFCFSISILLLTLSLFLHNFFFQKFFLYINDYEKLSAFECGFNPFSDMRSKFEVRFYLVAILFIVFDLEIIFLFPWVTVINQIGFFGFWVMFLFLFILVIGFIYEWIKGAMDWS